MTRIRTACLLLLASMPLAGVAEVAASYQELWPGIAYEAGTVPYIINLENEGQDAQGIVEFISGGNSIKYPFELPKGTRKSFAAYPWVGDEYEGPKLRVSSNRGSYTIDLNAPQTNYYSNNLVFGMISDDPGRLRILRTDETNPENFTEMQQMVYDTYLLPELAPDRVVGYSPLDTLVLGEGAERLSDGAVAAIKGWVLTGGHLIFVGGSQTPLLNDPRWSDILPVRNARGIQTDAVGWLKNFGDAPQGPISIADVELVQPAVASMSEGRVAKAHRSVGLGRVIFLAVNPFEEPLRTWDGRKEMFTLLATQGTELATGIYEQNYASLDYPQYDDWMMYSGSPYAEVQEDDPFSVKLPHPTVILMVLAAYWVVVVPVLFGVLKKMGKRELAWVLAPVVSIGFAGIFFSFAGGLYGTSATRATQGVIFADSSMPEAYFIGREQLFLPQAKRYDLGLERVETLHSINMSYGYEMGRASNSSFQGQLVDVGEIEGIQVPVGSLSFREYGLRQKVNMGGGVLANVNAEVRDKVLYVNGTVTNNTDFEIAQANIYAEGYTLGRVMGLAPGGEGQFDIKIPITQNMPATLKVYVQGDVRGADSLGVALGSPIERGRAVQLICMLGDYPVKGGGN